MVIEEQIIPIKNVKSKKVEITVQNHGFVVSKKKLPKNLIETHVSFLINTCWNKSK